MQQTPLSTSHFILGDSLLRILQSLRTSGITTVMAFDGATVALLYKMIELLNPGRIPSVMILIGTKNLSRSPESEEARWESMLVCLLTAIWLKFQCTVLTLCTIPMGRTIHLTATRSQNEKIARWNNIVGNQTSRNARRLVLMDLEYELRALNQ